MRSSALLPLLALACGWALPAGTLAATAAETDFRPLAGEQRLGACKGVYAAPEQAAGGQGITATADQAVHAEGGVSRLEGQVQIEYQGRSVTAGTVTVDQQAQTFAVEGGLLLRQPGMALAGERAQGQLATGETQLEGASFLLHGPRLRGQAARLDSLADQTLVIHQGQFTSCEPQSGAWALRSQRIALHRAEGYGTARHVRLALLGLPIAYFPYLRFPTDDRRHSGFLNPAIGRSTDAGTETSLAYYFNLAPNYDLTYGLRSLWRRGLGHEADFRHLSRRSQSRLAAAYLGDDKIFVPREPGAAPAPCPAVPDQETGAPCPPLREARADRWLLHLTHASQAGHWTSRLNYAAVSDLDYLRDFGSPSAGRAGFHQLGSSLHAPVLERRGSLAYQRGNWRGRLALHGFQSLRQVRRDQYETLPRAALQYRRRGRLLDFALALQGTRFKSRTEAEAPPVTGDRRVLDASLALPLRRPWGRLIPRLDYIHRGYALEDTEPGADATPEASARRLSLDASLTLVKELRLFGRQALHTVEPRIFLLHMEEERQEELPSFDASIITPSYRQLFRRSSFTGYDRFGEIRQATLGLETSLSSLATGAQWATASIGQAFYHEERALGLGGGAPPADASPLFLALNANPLPHLSARFNYEYDTEADSLTRAHASLKYRPGPQKLLNVSWAYVKEERQRQGLLQNEREIKVSFVWPLSRQPASRWRLMGSWTHDRKSGSTIESLFGLEYNGCCTRTRLAFRRFLKDPRLPAGLDPANARREDWEWRADSGVFLEVQLKGLGSLGGRLDSLLEDRVPGYQAP